MEIIAEPVLLHAIKSITVWLQRDQLHEAVQTAVDDQQRQLSRYFFRVLTKNNGTKTGHLKRLFVVIN